MKRLYIFILFLFSPLYAYQGPPLNLKGAFPSLCDLPIFSFDTNLLDVKETSFCNPLFTGDALKYRELDLNFSYLHPFDPCTAFSLGAGFVGTEVVRRENLDFNETHFGYITLTLSGITQAIEPWMWKVAGAILMDTAELSLVNYALYQLILLGKYSFSKPLMFNVGFIAEMGLNKGKIWPVLGVDYYPSERLNFHLIYPLDISMEYFLIPQISIGGTCRFIRNRHRLKNTEPLPLGIFEYHSTGVEADVNFYPIDCLFITAFVGRTFNGDLKVTNRDNHNAMHYKFNNSPYCGLSANMSF